MILLLGKQNHHKTYKKCFNNIPGCTERETRTKHFNLVNSKEIKTFFPGKKGQVYNMKTLLLRISEFLGAGLMTLQNMALSLAKEWQAK